MATLTSAGLASSAFQPPFSAFSPASLSSPGPATLPSSSARPSPTDVDDRSAHPDHDSLHSYGQEDNGDREGEEAEEEGREDDYSPSSHFSAQPLYPPHSTVPSHPFPSFHGYPHLHSQAPHGAPAGGYLPPFAALPPPPHGHPHASAPPPSLPSFLSGFSPSAHPRYAGAGNGGGMGSAAPPANSGGTVCRMYATGYCKWGQSCRFLHLDAPSGRGGAMASQPPPGLGPPAPYHTQVPHLQQQQQHAHLMQQHFEAMVQQQQQQQAPHHAPAHPLSHQQPPHFYHPQSAVGDGGGVDEQQPRGSGGRVGAEDESAELGGGPLNGGGAEEEGPVAEERETDEAEGEGPPLDSSSASTPHSTTPSSSSVATTAGPSSSSSPSTLSARATPFSSSFPSPAFSPFAPPQSSFPPSHSYAPPPFYPKSYAPSHPPTASFNPSPSFGRPPQYPPPSQSQGRDAQREAELFGDASTGINFDSYDDIEVDVQGVDCPPPIASFDDLHFPPSLQHNLSLAHYSKPTPVQKYALPCLLQGRDVMACAQTGSGKTAAFLFPLISQLLHSGLGAGGVSGVLGYGKQKRYAPSGLILAPTRELASQIYDEAVKFCWGSSLHPVVVYGGQDIRYQFRELDRGCDLLVATPGRLMDFVERGRITLSHVGYLVFDEADRMLDMGFEPQIRQIVQQSDMPHSRQTLMFSATFPKEIQRLAQDFLQSYIFIAVGRVGSSSDLITQRVEWVEDEDKQAALLRLLPQCQGLTLIFVERKRTADLLEAFLSRHNYSVTSIHGDRSQHEREAALAHFRASRCPFLVATDVAARGLDIPNVLDVINFDTPTCIEDYVHRIGRTGRCGRTGTATSFINRASQGVVRELYDMLRENKQEVPPWLEQYYRDTRQGGGGRGGRAGGRGGRGGWGARDLRQGQFGSRGAGAGRGRGGFGRGGGGGFGGMGMMGMTGMGMGGMSGGMGMGMGYGEGAMYPIGSHMHPNGMEGGGDGGQGDGSSRAAALRGGPPLTAAMMGMGGGGGNAALAGQRPNDHFSSSQREAW